MQPTNDWDLLRAFACENSQEAFAALVQRYLNLVYSSGLRQVRSHHLAEEVAQSVFTDLARNAHRLTPDTILAAWLYEVTRRTASNVLRGEVRRLNRERIAAELTAMNASPADWIRIEPLLDEAMHTLDGADRTVVLLRYFENKSLRQVGAILGITDEAARKRLSRAVDRLRDFFATRGVTLEASVLTLLVSGNAVQSAPVGLGLAVATNLALNGSSFATAATVTLAKNMAMTTLQKTAIGAALLAAVSTGVYQAHRVSTWQAQVRDLLQLNTQLTEQRDQFQRTQEEAEQQVAVLHGENERLKRSGDELAKLRGELTRLRRENLARSAPQAANPPALPPPDVDPTWVRKVLEASPKYQGAAAGQLRAKLLRQELTNISPSELALRNALLQRGLNQTLERSPEEFADFQSAYIQAALAISDETRVQQMHGLIRQTYEQAVAAGLDIPSKPADNPETWVQQRHELDRWATSQLKHLFTPDEQELFDRAFLGVMGVDLGGVGVDKSNYPNGFLSPE